MPIEQAALLWCMRLWVAGYHESFNPTVRIGRIARQLDAPEVGGLIEGFMFALQHGATRPIEIGCLQCTKTRSDERMLLDTLGLAQERRPFEALLLLRGVLTPDGARAALCSAEGVGSALARVGRFLPAPDASVTQFALDWPAEERR